MPFPAQLFKNIIYAYLFWIMVFFAGKIIFILSTLIWLSDTSFFDVLKIFYYGFKLDLATAGYFVTLNAFFLLFYNITGSYVLKKTLFYINLIILIAYFSIVVSEIALYREWQSKPNYKIFTYLKNPAEVIQSADTFFLIAGTILLAVLSFFFFRLQEKFVVFRKKESIISSVLWFPLILGFNILIIRGGFKAIPINLSDAYFSDDFTKNDAAVNSAWNLIHSLLENKKYLSENPYKYMDDKEAAQIVEKLYATPKDTVIHLFNDKQPNIILIILESWSADIVKELNGFDSVAPNFSALCKKGLLFTQCYATGFRSDMGMASILSGYPAQPTTTITEQPEKVKKLPVISRYFKKMGYQTAFIFGGQLIYGNIKGLILHGKYDKIIEGENFPDTVPRNKLAVYDEFLFQRVVRELKQKTKPFFYTVFTASTHSPYDVPVKKSFHFEKENDYMESAWYTDYSIGKFIEQCSRQPWFDNTIFIFIADHSHPTPRQWEYHSKENKHIPFLIFGKPLKETLQGKTFDKITSQVDLPHILLSQFSITDTAFQWSKNPLNPYTEEFAYYICGDGFGWVRPKGYFSYRHDLDRYIQQNFENDSVKHQYIKEGKAYLQTLFNDYLNK